MNESREGSSGIWLRMDRTASARLVAFIVERLVYEDVGELSRMLIKWESREWETQNSKRMSVSLVVADFKIE